MIRAVTTFYRRLRAARQSPPTVDVGGTARTARSASLGIEVIKRDGTRIAIGDVTVYHANPIVHAWRQWKADRRMARFYRDHPEHDPRRVRTPTNGLPADSEHA